jgi:hypothetical protein
MNAAIGRVAPAPVKVDAVNIMVIHSFVNGEFYRLIAEGNDTLENDIGRAKRNAIPADGLPTSGRPNSLRKLMTLGPAFNPIWRPGGQNEFQEKDDAEPNRYPHQ